MTIQEFRDAREANPFRPFTIHLADGRSFRVPHRDYVSMSPEKSRTVIVYKASGNGFSILDLLLVTELAFEEQPVPGGGGNGGNGAQ